MSARMFVRPNGKVYRPRKDGLELHEYSDQYNGDTGIVVFGTHDYLEAANFAGWRMADYGLDQERAEETWWRSVPWGGDDNRSWIQDDVRGRPCVVFEPTPWYA